MLDKIDGSIFITELQRKAIRKYAAKAIKEIVDDITKSLPKIKEDQLVLFLFLKI